NCEFAECPVTNPQPVVECKKDSDCSAGNLCHKNICTSPIGRQCAGPEDTTCPEDFECVEGCGPPVVRYPDETPLKYFCQLKGYIRSCPICLAKNTLIDASQGPAPVQDIKKGDLVWTLNESGGRVIGVVVKTSKTLVPLNHKMVKLILEDGRTLFVSPGHPTTDGRSVKSFRPGDLYSNSKVLSSDLVFYSDEFTYDILPSGPTGFYFANDIPLASTLKGVK
ncbi:MAG: hypothetical protein Q8O66_00155, partial [bacterium]|nr:hypothetical protein [bacterium]